MDVSEQRVGVRTVIRAHRSPLREPLEDLHPAIAGAFRSLHKLGQGQLRRTELQRMLEHVLSIRRRSVSKWVQQGR